MPATKDINVLALAKGAERYVFLFDDEHRDEALRTLGRYASNPELSFTWFDAMSLGKKIRQTEIASDDAVEGRVTLKSTGQQP